MLKSIVISIYAVLLLEIECYSPASARQKSTTNDSEEFSVVKQTEKNSERNQYPVKVFILPEDKLSSTRHSYSNEAAGFEEQKENSQPLLKMKERANDETTREACQVTVKVPDDLRCSLGSAVESQIGNLHQLLSSMQTQMNHQRRRLDSADYVIRRLRYTITQRQGDRKVTNAPLKGSVRGVQDDVNVQSSDFSSRPYRSEAAETLRSLSEEMQVMLANLEIQIDEADNRRETLLAENLNLTRELHRKRGAMRNLTRENEMLKMNSSSLVEALTAKENENIVLQTDNNRLRREKESLEKSNHILEENSAAQEIEINRLNIELTTLRAEAENLRTERRSYERNLSSATKQIIKMNSVITLLHAKNHTKRGCNNGNGISAIDETDQYISNYTHCGVLLNVSEPQTIRQSRKPILHRIGVWMKDPLATKHSNRIWLINQSGVRVRKVYQYANMSAFQNHRPEAIHTLPVPMESNGAVVYNGSLFFQRRNSRRIVKYVFANRNHMIDRSIKRAGFHGMFAYQWGGFTDIDFAVDETGLWVIYSTPRSRGNIVVSEINPKTLQIVRTIRTPIQKRKVANAFIICQVLYTVSGFRSPVTSINYSFDLNAKKGKKLNIPLSNNYQFNSMIDYNPRDRFIYAWDNGRQVRYKATLDTSLGKVHSSDSDSSIGKEDGNS